MLEEEEKTLYAGSLDRNLPFFSTQLFLLIHLVKCSQPFRGRSRPTAAICAPHFAQRLKTDSASRRIFLAHLEQPTHERVGRRSADTIWTPVRRTFQDQEQLRRANEPRNLLRVSASSSTLTGSLGAADYSSSWVTQQQQMKP